MKKSVISFTLALRGIAFPCTGHAPEPSGLPSQPETLILIGQQHFEAGRYREAESYYRLALTANPRGPLLASVLNNLGSTLPYVGKDDEAVSALTLGLSAAESAYGKSHSRLRPFLNNLAVLHRKRSEHKPAVMHLKRALQLGTDAGEQPQADVVFTLHNLAWVYFDMGQTSKAEKYLSQCESLLERFENAHPALRVPTLSLRARIKVQEGDYAGAAAIYGRILDDLFAEHGEEHPAIAAVLSDMGEAQALSGRTADAEETYERALRVFEAVKADTHPALIRTLFRLAELRLARKQYDSAVSLFRQTNAHIERLHGPNYLALAATAPGYASALRKTGRKDEARAVEERAAMIRRAVPVELAGRHTVDLKSLLPRAK